MNKKCGMYLPVVEWYFRKRITLKIITCIPSLSPGKAAEIILICFILLVVRRGLLCPLA